MVDATGVLRGKLDGRWTRPCSTTRWLPKDTVTQLIAAVRRTRRVVPGAAAVPVSAHDYDAAGKPVIAWDDPVAKAALVDGLVKDALAIIGAFPEPPAEPQAASALGLLALVAGQDVEQADDGTWRVARKSRPRQGRFGGRPRSPSHAQVTF